MSHQLLLVHHFFPLKVQVLEKNFLRESCSISENKQRLLKKHQFCTHNKYMSHKRSPVHHFFPLNVQDLEKNFLRKSGSISEN